MAGPLPESLPQRIAGWLAGLLLSFWVWLNCEADAGGWALESSTQLRPPDPALRKHTLPRRTRPLYSPPRR
jgi:hypothetical protein